MRKRPSRPLASTLEAPLNLRTEIEEAFHGKAFIRPLFHEYGQALRFELSEGRSAIELFQSALKTALCICEGRRARFNETSCRA